jgi:hypothetical protein
MKNPPVNEKRTLCKRGKSCGRRKRRDRPRPQQQVKRTKSWRHSTNIEINNTCNIIHNSASMKQKNSLAFCWFPTRSRGTYRRFALPRSRRRQYARVPGGKASGAAGSETSVASPRDAIERLAETNHRRVMALSLARVSKSSSLSTRTFTANETASSMPI